MTAPVQTAFTDAHIMHAVRLPFDVHVHPLVAKCVVLKLRVLNRDLQAWHPSAGNDSRIGSAARVERLRQLRAHDVRADRHHAPACRVVIHGDRHVDSQQSAHGTRVNVVLQIVVVVDLPLGGRGIVISQLRKPHAVLAALCGNLHRKLHVRRVRSLCRNRASLQAHVSRARALVRERSQSTRDCVDMPGGQLFSWTPVNSKALTHTSRFVLQEDHVV
jgi:hypothetical protein